MNTESMESMSMESSEYSSYGTGSMETGSYGTGSMETSNFDFSSYSASSEGSVETQTPYSHQCMDTPKIIGGQQIDQGQPPFEAEWIVGLSMGCGGSWINQETILTAAHCFGSQPSAGQSFSVYSKGQDGRQEHLMDFTGDQVTVHENYDDQTLTNDVAVIRFCGYTGEHAMVGLPDQDQVPTHPVYFVYGWGNTNPQGNNYPEILNWVQTPTVSFDTCASNYNLGNEYNSNMIVCAGQQGIAQLKY